MGVFKSHQNKDWREKEEPKVFIQQEEINSEMIHCKFGHAIDGVVPTVDPNKFEIQNPQLIGKMCDCQQLVYAREQACGCQHDQWGIIWDAVTFDYAAHEEMLRQIKERSGL